jgi:hypothetical protein
MRPVRLVERLIISASFSAFRRLVRLAPPAMLQGLAPLSALGVMWTSELLPLQTLCGMLAGHGLSLAAPMPSEPVDYLVAPVVLLYFGVIGGVGWCVVRVCAPPVPPPFFSQVNNNTNKKPTIIL